MIPGLGLDPSDLAGRHARLDTLIAEAHALLDRAIREEIVEHRDGNNRGREHVATAVLFSGGNDSTVLAHLFRDVATHAIHANTGIGVEATRQFVRNACAGWGLPLIEKHPPVGGTYRDIVLAQGFPGPAHHWKMYTRLKERALEQAKNDLVSDPYRQRVVFLAGRRRSESSRRQNIPEVERRKSVVWVSPLRGWTSLDLNTYRMRFPDCPRNEVADQLHMSGECLCGAFAGDGELDMLRMWPCASDAVATIEALDMLRMWPCASDAVATIEALEAEVRDVGIPEPLCRWGWGGSRSPEVRRAADAMRLARERSRSGPLCSSCEMNTLFDSMGDA